MATYAQIEDLRDWFIDTVGEFLSRTDVINGEEDQTLLETVRAHTESMHQDGIKVIAGLDALLVKKKREERIP